MTWAEDSVCSPWATESELLEHCPSLNPFYDELPPSSIEDALLAASDALYTLSGRIFTGLCVKTVAPFVDTCRPQTKVNIGLWPVHAVTSVNSGATVVDPTTYSLFGFKYLKFTGAIPSDLKVTVQYGMIPPLLGKRACTSLACELLAAFMDEECAIPGGVATSISRQGISSELINPEDLLENGRTGIYDVDRFLMIYNPNKIPSPTFVISPDTVASEHIPMEYSWPHGR